MKFSPFQSVHDIRSGAVDQGAQADKDLLIELQKLADEKTSDRLAACGRSTELRELLVVVMIPNLSCRKTDDEVILFKTV